MAISSVASSGVTVQAAPPRPSEAAQAVAKPAEKVPAPAQPPPQRAEAAPSVNTSGQRIGSTINTTA